MTSESAGTRHSLARGERFERTRNPVEYECARGSANETHEGCETPAFETRKRPRGAPGGPPLTGHVPAARPGIARALGASGSSDTARPLIGYQGFSFQPSTNPIPIAQRPNDT